MATSGTQQRSDVGLGRKPTRTHTSESSVIADSLTSSRKHSVEPESHVVHDGDQHKAPARPGHQRFVLTDTVAFRYLEEDGSTVVLDRRRQLQGYECYIVEQWACARSHPTFVITTYTGDTSHKVIAGVLSIPTNEEAWSQRLRVYFRALGQYHARPRETPIGTLMITNLSAFPSSLTVIPVPDGDVRKHRESFFVNENLKRLGCSGRVGIKLGPVSNATEAKFHQLYRTSEKIPLAGAVIELVKLCQVALVLFGKLEPEYADGLLCDITEKAVNDWWLDIGNEYYNTEPHDGILGPTTVAALLGMLIGARNRLNAYGAPIAKDVFDVEATKRGIAYFQKSQRLQKTRRLDRQTLGKLHRATAKAASGEGWTVPRAVKSTVAELSGKGGEMVMDIVGGRDKAGIAEVETVDIERFVQLVHGERSKWLWYGKPRKHHGTSMFSRLPDDGAWAHHKDDEFQDDSTHNDTGEGAALRKQGTQMSVDPEDIDADPRRTVLRRATGKMNDTRSSIGGRIKGAVGLRGHQHKQSKHESDMQQYSANGYSSSAVQQSEETPPCDRTPRESMDIPSAEDGRRPFPAYTKDMSETPQHTSLTNLSKNREVVAEGDEQPELGALQTINTNETCRTAAAPSSIAGSTYHGIDLDELFDEDERFGAAQMLRRTQSFSRYMTRRGMENRNDDRWPRCLSLSIAEESLFRWEDISTGKGECAIGSKDARTEMAQQAVSNEEMQRYNERLTLLGCVVNKWVERKISGVEELNAMAERDQQELEELYYPRLEEYQSLRDDTKETISHERGLLLESVKEVETLGAKLEYEINALRSKVEDVEDGVVEFERQVRVVEDMVQTLESECRGREGWVRWGVKMMTGSWRRGGGGS
ncbi:hypothetical protein K490DRAFT_62545 [Saccharata proteae CBS 121410]|uniref:STB6-like N-terminal domain-containing protein n=1 Tax=Saccharata proteae CBS 121410 TaxID=1314787 RepID=A0A9P4LZL4_9PEZI|nr:hypothetical protein K490DRAFT_62545 [Saccharata proteae CBS 121410]